MSFQGGPPRQSNPSSFSVEVMNVVLPPELTAQADSARSSRSSWYSESTIQLNDVPLTSVENITDQDILSVPHEHERIKVASPSPQDIATKLYLLALATLENYFIKFPSIRYYLANECIFLAQGEFKTLTALATWQKDRPPVDEIEIRILAPRNFMHVLQLQPGHAIALKKAEPGHPGINLFWDNAFEGSLKLCYVLSNSKVFHTPGSAVRGSEQRYIQVTFANYTDSYFRGELDLYSESLHFYHKTNYGIIPRYTRYLVRLLVNVKRLIVQIDADKAAVGSDKLDDVFLETKRRYICIIASMCDNAHFGEELTEDEKKLFTEVTRKKWEDKVQPERRNAKV